MAVAPKIYTFNDNSAYLHLDEVAPPTTGDVWLIVDEDNDEKFVFSLPLSKIKKIIEECRYFEYYIVDKNLKWLLAENDHGDLIFPKKILPLSQRPHSTELKGKTPLKSLMSLHNNVDHSGVVIESIPRTNFNDKSIAG